METPSKPFRTTKLTLAVYLIDGGFEPKLVRVDGQEVKEDHPQGAWEFEDSPSLRGEVQLFESELASVEPEEFHQLLNKTRNEMFEFLGIRKGS